MLETIHVLQIEDSPLVVELTRSMLDESKRGEFELEAVGSLAEGIKRLARGSVDVVLLDLTLPDSQGLDTFDVLHAAAAKVPVVIYTSADDEEQSLQALRRGAADYLVKSEVNAKWLARSLTFVLHRDRYLTADSKSAKAEVESTDQAITIEKSENSPGSFRVQVNGKRMVSVVVMEAIKNRLQKLVRRSDCQEIRIDFTNVEYVANSAISMLLIVNKQTKSAGKQLVLCQVSPQVYEQFSSRRFDKVFQLERMSSP